MTTEPIDLDDLQALAELSRTSWEPNPEGEWFTRDGLLNGNYSFDVPDSDYIEAVLPATVLALVAELKESRAAIARVRVLAFSDGVGANEEEQILAALEGREL
jgi:hypothetical protein